MSIVSNPNNLFCTNHFIFIENNILILNQSEKDNSIPYTKDALPDENIIRKCLENQIASDWFAEPDKDYFAMMLEKDTPVPSQCKSIPLREFFWNSKGEDLKKTSINSPIGNLAARAHGFLRLRQSYRYCPTCGGKLTDDSFNVAKKCSVCSRLLFPRIEPCIIVLVKKDNQMLLVKNKNRTSDYYSCIAGFIEHGESAEECVKREVKEEVGLEIKNIKYAGSQTWPFPDQLMLAYTAEYKSGNIKIQEEELDEAKWFNKDDTPPLYKPGSVAYGLIHGLFN